MKKAAEPALSISLACEALEVSRSGFYAWQQRQQAGEVSRRRRRREELTRQVRRIHRGCHRRYGAPRVTAELRAKGWRVSENTVAAIMRAEGLEGRSGRRKTPKTTQPARTAVWVDDLVRRRFTVSEIDRVYCTDITYVPTRQGWLYVAVILDAASRSVTGWAAREHLRASLPLEALRMALGARRPAPGLIVHSDRGSQFTSQAWLDALAEAGARPSMGRVGWCWDNAMAESWFAGYKNELVIPAGTYPTLEAAKLETYRYIRWHNTQRRHSALGYLAPHDYEHARTLTNAA